MFITYLCRQKLTFAGLQTLKVHVLLLIWVTVSLTAACDNNDSNNPEVVADCHTTLQSTFKPHAVWMKSVHHVRLLDGIVTADGRRVRSELLVRTASLAGITDSDLIRLADSLGVRNVIDLRTNHRAHQHPDTLYPAYGITLTHLPLLNTANEFYLKLRFPDMDEEHLLKAATEARAAAMASALYEELLTSRHCQQQLASFIRHVAAVENGAVLWHCTIGRDRTGVASALLLLALGVDKSTVVADFEWGVLLASGYDAATRPDTLSLCTQHFSQLLYTIEQRYGTFDAYLRQIGITEGDIRSLQQHFLEPY